MNETAYVRAYIKSNKETKPRNTKQENNLIFVFDTETTNDEYQNLKFGSFAIHSENILIRLGIFYNPKCVSENELRVLRKFCKINNLQLFELKEFIEEIFFEYVYNKKALCICFNSPFDLSRLAISYTYARGSMNGGFSFKLSGNKSLPRLKIKHLDNSKSFIRFGTSLKDNFDGNFVDLKTLAVTLTDNKHITLEKACEMFNSKYQKIKTLEHGKITEKYIEYNINDTLATCELFTKLKEEFEQYNIDISLSQVYSSASMGKACLKQLGIKPFLESNSSFSSEIIGYTISTYYGGRCECRIRKQPVKVSVLDFRSMYPTMFILLDLWSFLTTDKIECIEGAKNVSDFIDKISIEDLQNPETWKQLNAIVEIEPNEDVLPIRMDYGNDKVLNIGINYITSERRLWYTLADIIASKLYTERTPKITRAIRFVAVDTQNALTKSKILGIEIDPCKQNLFKTLIEEREKIRETNDSRQRAIKILANATSYGIFIEINDEKKKAKVEIFGISNFYQNVNKVENTGIYFNPIIATSITSGARLVLAIAEILLAKHNKTNAYCDTDSIFISSNHVKEVQDFFQKLNPYEFNKPLFKVEEENLWFYGISSKRYVLYDFDGKNFIIKDMENDENYSLHGLGHLLDPFGKSEKWHKKVWIDIIRLHYDFVTKEKFFNRYRDFYAVSKFAVSTMELVRRFKGFNKGKQLEKQIKPFNFFLIGFKNKDGIKPISPYSNNPQEAVYSEFIDYKTGKILEGLEYWKSLGDTLLDYINHDESKLEGETGILKRRHVKIKNIVHIGKETENLERTGILDEIDYPYYFDVKALLEINPKEASKLGIKRNTLWHIKKRIASGKPLKLSSKVYARLLKGGDRIG
jgi:hypothetical protein